MVNQEDPVPSDVDFARELESLLEQHDYESPKVGDIRDAVIVSISPQGVIVDLGMKRDGIIQPSDLDKLEPEERDGLTVNDEIPVYILNTDEQDSLEVSLYMARMNEDWIEAQGLLESGEILESEIIGHNRGGALVSFGRLRGFVPASHLTFLQHGMNDQDRQRRLARAHGETIPLKVIEVDRRRRRLVLSHREAEREWQSERRKELLADLKEGDVIEGRVTGWRDFGAFVDLGGADGLVHVSELAWHRVEHPREVVKMGETLDVYVLNVDRERERISLSRKKLLPNPWTLVDDKYSVGELVEGTIIRIVDYGAFVEVEPGVEGLLHTSQISRGTVDSPEAMLAEGETHLLRIISIDADRQRMGLSLKAVTPTEQIEWMTQREHEQVEAEDEEGEVIETEAAAGAQTDASAPDEVETESERASLEAETGASEAETVENAAEESELREAAEEVAVTTEVEGKLE
jgi:small subunit ribosomal protein S1